MRRLTRASVIFILAGVILLITPRVQAMDRADYLSWDKNICKIASALAQVGVVVSSTEQSVQAMEIYSKLSGVALQLRSWAEKVSPPSTDLFAYHSHLKSALRYEHLTFAAWSRGNWELGTSYAKKSSQEFMAASKARPKPFKFRLPKFLDPLIK